MGAQRVESAKWETEKLWSGSRSSPSSMRRSRGVSISHAASKFTWRGTSIGGESAAASGGVTGGLLDLGQRVTWRAKHFGVWQTLTSEITAMDRPRFFRDTMIRGAFRSMEHDHFFRPLPEDRNEMKDVFCFEAPLGLLGRAAEVAILRRYRRALLMERNSVLKGIAESGTWCEYLRR